MTPLDINKICNAAAMMAADSPKRGISLIMKKENNPSSLTLSAFSFVVDEAGGLMERIVKRVWRVMQVAFANIFFITCCLLWLLFGLVLVVGGRLLLCLCELT